jgi:hypothetical protein
MNMKRMRGRNHRPNNSGGGGGGFRNQQNGIPLNRNHVFDSSGPEMRVRGTAQQLYDKYTQMARDASSSGDRVLGEAYYQHAEHYFRIISAINQAQGLPNPVQGGQPQNGDFQRREPGNEGNETQANEPRQENRPDNRQERQENRGENRGENRNENRQERRFEPRQQRPDFQPRERGERQFRPAPVVDAPIDISSALEAELAAAAAPAGFGEQPAIPHELPLAPEPRAIPIIAVPPPAPAPAPAPVPEPVATAEAAPEEPAPAPRPRPRGRPRTVKTEAAKTE